MSNLSVSSKKDSVREDILTIAQDIFSRYGYKKTTLDDIAQAIRKGKSSLYYYFSSKEDLFQAVINKEADFLKSELAKVVEKNIEPEEKIREYITTKLITYRDLGNLYNAIQNDLVAVEFLEQIKNSYEKEEIRMTKRILLEGARKGKFEIQDFTLSAIGITTAIKGLEIPLAAGTWRHSDLEKSVDMIVKIICYGIMKR